MALRKIVLEGDDVLRKKCRNVDTFDEKLWDLLDDMADTMYNAEGVGLAAPQVGVLKQVVVIDIGDKLYELVNPKIIAINGEQIGNEGCLSCPGETWVVKRPMAVVCVAKNRFGKDIRINGTELFARAICHELDHLNGVLFKDVADYKVTEEN